VHGPPQKLYSDNGGEFNNNEMREMAKKFNMEVKNLLHTVRGAMDFWRDTIRHREIMLEVKQDDGCDWKTPLDWTLMARNSMHNVHSYSP
jgi:hypothetical protein